MSQTEASALDAVAAGHLCLDLHPRFTSAPGIAIPDLFQPGRLLRMGPMTFSTGGAVSNTGLAMRAFGCRMAYVARVGDDTLGRIVVETFRRHGDAAGIRLAPGEHTSYSVVLSPPGIDRMFLHLPGTNDTFSSADIAPAIPARARLFHFGYPTLMDGTHADGGRELCAIFRRVRETGATTSLDISFPDPNSPAGRADWRAIYAAVLPDVDVFCPSIEEACYTLDPAMYRRLRAAHPEGELVERFGPDDYRRIAGAFLEMGCAVVGLKAGPRGWYLRTAERGRIEAMGRAAPADTGAWATVEAWQPAFHIEQIAGATGAGDCSIAGFLTGLLKGLGPADCLRAAAGAGWMNLRAPDALGGLGSWDELQRLLPTLSPVPR
jgi:sugar/nucleoside kinase (ribokinase family)